mmetsp:Transcript_18592/g.55004  ORF Transcript_18592/g.55004 Transcript_18592/m.55004 type:complete len:294 (+) Transcript_18592:140-1021(+)
MSPTDLQARVDVVAVARRQIVVDARRSKPAEQVHVAPPRGRADVHRHVGAVRLFDHGVEDRELHRRVVRERRDGGVDAFAQEVGDEARAELRVQRRERRQPRRQDVREGRRQALDHGPFPKARERARAKVERAPFERGLRVVQEPVDGVAQRVRRRHDERRRRLARRRGVERSARGEARERQRVPRPLRAQGPRPQRLGVGLQHPEHPWERTPTIEIVRVRVGRPGVVGRIRARLEREVGQNLIRQIRRRRHDTPRCVARRKVEERRSRGGGGGGGVVVVSRVVARRRDSSAF